MIAIILLPLLFFCSASAVVYPDCEAGPLASNLVCNTNASVHDRASALVDALTLEETVDNMVQAAPGAPRLGLPPYTWYREALVSPRILIICYFFLKPRLFLSAIARCGK